jgi:hypothetical protein
MKRIKRAKLFVFLRQQRHTLFDAAFQDELATIYKDAPQGQPPIPPAQLALATILQAYTGVSDDDWRLTRCGAPSAALAHAMCRCNSPGWRVRLGSTCMPMRMVSSSLSGY